MGVAKLGGRLGPWPLGYLGGTAEGRRADGRGRLPGLSACIGNLGLGLGLGLGASGGRLWAEIKAENAEPCTLEQEHYPCYV